MLHYYLFKPSMFVYFQNSYIQNEIIYPFCFYSLFTPSFSTISQILKLLDNEDMDPSALDGIKDDIDYYIEVQTARATLISFLNNT